MWSMSTMYCTSGILSGLYLIMWGLQDNFESFSNSTLDFPEVILLIQTFFLLKAIIRKCFLLSDPSKSRTCIIIQNKYYIMRLEVNVEKIIEKEKKVQFTLDVDIIWMFWFVQKVGQAIIKSLQLTAPACFRLLVLCETMLFIAETPCLTLDSCPVLFGGMILIRHWTVLRFFSFFFFCFLRTSENVLFIMSLPVISQDLEERVLRSTSPSLLSATVGQRLLTRLDDGSGCASPESVVTVWTEEGIRNSRDILQVRTGFVWIYFFICFLSSHCKKLIVLDH